MSQFPAQPFKPDGGFNPGGLLILIAALAGAAIGLGWLASFIGQWFYIVLFFSIGIGFALVVVGNKANQLAKLRNPALAAVIGLGCGALTMASSHYFNYLRFLPAREEAMKFAPLLDNLPGELKDDKLRNLAEFINEARPADNFLSFLDMEARRGVTIGTVGRPGDKGSNLGYVGTWAYWCAELMIVALLATAGMRDLASTPYCAACERWKEERVLGALSGNQADLVVTHLRDGQIDLLSKHDPNPSEGNLVLSVGICPNCRELSPIVVKLEQVTTNAKGQVTRKKLAHLTYPGDALPAFEALYSHKRGLADDE